MVVGLGIVPHPGEDGITICVVGEGIVEDMPKGSVLNDVRAVADWCNEDTHSYCSEKDGELSNLL